MRIVMVSGYFNPLHKGHIEYFNKSKEHGDKLYVIVNNDKQRELKGSKEFQNEDERMFIIKNLKKIFKRFLIFKRFFNVFLTNRLNNFHVVLLKSFLNFLLLIFFLNLNLLNFGFLVILFVLNNFLKSQSIKIYNKLKINYQDWFDFPIPSPFMLYTAKVKQPEKIPAVTHIDGSARFQTINQETNLTYYNLIKEFKNITGFIGIRN